MAEPFASRATSATSRTPVKVLMSPSLLMTNKVELFTRMDSFSSSSMSPLVSTLFTSTEVEPLVMMSTSPLEEDFTVPFSPSSTSLRRYSPLLRSLYSYHWLTTT